MKKSFPWLFVGALTLAYLAMVLWAYFRPWLLVPDFVLLVLWVFLLYAPTAIVWSFLALLSAVVDVSSGTPLGVHALVYALFSLLMLSLAPRWPLFSLFLRAVFVFGLSILVCAAQFLILYVLTHESAPQGWPTVVLWQALLWGVVRLLLCLSSSEIWERVRND